MGNCSPGKEEESAGLSAEFPAKSGHDEAEVEDEVPGALRLMVAIAGVRGIREASWQPSADKPDCFCVVRAPSKEEELCRTRGVKGAFEPAWMEEFEVTRHRPFDGLQFGIWEADELLGTVALGANAFKPAGFNGLLRLDGTGKGVEAYLKVKVGVQWQDYPKGESAEFSVTVTRGRDKALGLDVDSQDGAMCFVDKIRKGPFQTHNQNSKAAEQLRPGDFIMKANEFTGDSSKLLMEMKSASTLTLLVRRCEEFEVTVERAAVGKPWGLDISEPSGNSLMVADVVRKGIVHVWNAVNVDREVRKGDRVVAVCGKRGTAAELETRLSELKQIEMTVIRPASLTSWRFW